VHSPTAHLGDRPIVLLTNEIEQQVTAIHQAFIAAAKKFRLPLHGGAILCPSSQLARTLVSRLKNLGSRSNL
jgi:hypothetical protein